MREGPKREDAEWGRENMFNILYMYIYIIYMYIYIKHICAYKKNLK